ncbi:MAG TPA: hypothetical protein VK943_08590 [Arenibaculum sp.]|nr:hypothetical protein [Arenibaculum sp.]
MSNLFGIGHLASVAAHGLPGLYGARFDHSGETGGSPFHPVVARTAEPEAGGLYEVPAEERTGVEERSLRVAIIRGSHAGVHMKLAAALCYPAFAVGMNAFAAEHRWRVT